MILTNWAYCLTALFHCSLPPYILPDCMKWLLKSTGSNQGFRLTMTTALLSDAADAARQRYLSPNQPQLHMGSPNSSSVQGRPTTKLGEAPTDATRHALLSHEAVIEQWLHVGLFLYPINTVAQQLWTIAYSYSLHVLTHHTGHHLHADHPTADLNPTDTDYLETHPFMLKYKITEHPIPVTHYRPPTELNPAPKLAFRGQTVDKLHRRFYNLMRLRGFLHSITFIVRTNLAAIRRRAYTNELLGLKAPHLTITAITIRLSPQTPLPPRTSPLYLAPLLPLPPRIRPLDLPLKQDSRLGGYLDVLEACACVCGLETVASCVYYMGLCLACPLKQQAGMSKRTVQQKPTSHQFWTHVPDRGSY